MRTPAQECIEDHSGGAGADRTVARRTFASVVHAALDDLQHLFLALAVHAINQAVLGGNPP